MKVNRCVLIRALTALCLFAGLLAASASAAPRAINLDPLVDELCYVSCSWTVTIDAVESEDVNYQAVVDAAAGLTLTVDPDSFTLEPGGSQELTVTAEVGGLTLDEEVQAEISLLAAQPSFIEESFDDSDFPPAGWSTHLLAGSTDYSWSRTENNSNSGPASALRGFDASGDQDDWLVTPAFQVELGMELSFFDRASFMAWYEYSALKVSTASCDPADGDFIEFRELDDSTTNWRMINQSLDTWAGETVCLAFHYTGQDAQSWYIDDVTVTEAVFDDYSIDVSVIPRSPELTLAPEELQATQFADRQETHTLTIGNDGLVELNWSFPAPLSPQAASREAARPEPGLTKPRHDPAITLIDALAEDDELAEPTRFSSRVGSPIDCDAQPGIIIHDDGIAENGYSANVSEVTFVDPFVPTAYPAVLESVCLAFNSREPVASLDIEVVVYADDGPDGQPGTELGSVAATMTEIGLPGESTESWNKVDLSSLGLTLEEGRLFVGARWAPPTPRVFIAADENASTPRVGGYWFNGNVWATIQSGGVPDYRALLIRLVAPSACDLIGDIPWLSAASESGTVAVAGSNDVQLMFDSTGLAEGVYEADLCLFSDDLNRPSAILPVTMTVVAEPLIALSASSVDFGLVFSDEQQSTTVTITSTGSGELVIDQIIAPDAPFALTGGSCLAVPLQLLPGDSCDIDITFAPHNDGEFESSIGIVSNADSSPDAIALRGTSSLPVAVPALGPLGLFVLILLLGTLAGRHAIGRRGR